MKVCMISRNFLPDTVGGVELHVYHLSRALQKIGVDVTVIRPVMARLGDHRRVDRAVIDGIPVLRIVVPTLLNNIDARLKETSSDNALGYLAGFLRKVTPVLLSGSFYKLAWRELLSADLVHQHDFSSSWHLTRRISKMTPTILTNHTGEFLFIRRNRFLRHILRPLLSHYRAIIGPSQELCDMGFPDERVRYVANGVDVDYFSPPPVALRQQIREELGFRPDHLLVVCPRRWAPTKGIKLLVDAIPIVKKGARGMDVKFLMVGSDYNEYPAYRGEVLDQIRKFGLTEEVVLLGNATQEQMRKYLWASDVAVIPSLMEATSLSALEAMAVRLPVVATRVGGLPEIIETGVNGLLVEPQSASSLAEGLLLLIHDASERLRMGANGRALAVQLYSWEAVARAAESIYQDVLTT